MMRLDCLSRLGPDNIRINRSLSQEIDAVQLAGFLFKNTNKLRADDFTLLLRFADPSKLIKETIDCVDINQVRSQLVTEHLHHLLRLTLSQQAMVHVNAGQLIADRADQKSGHNGGIHAAEALSCRPPDGG